MLGEEKLESLLNWAVENGSVIDSRVDFRYTEKSGISAFLKEENKDAKPLEIQVAEDCIVTPTVALKFFQEKVPDLKKDEKKDEEEYSKVYVQLLKYFIGYVHTHLANDKLSYWKPYFDCLPSKVEDFNIPLTWPIEELKFFEGTNMFTGVNLKVVQLFKEYIQMSKELKTDISEEISEIKDPESYPEIYEYLINAKTIGSKVTSDEDCFIGFKAYLYGHQIVTSRSFPYRFIKPEAPLDSVMLLPVVDLLNHQPARKVFWEGNSKGFKITLPLEDIKETNQLELFNNYGPKGNEELLMGYGFVIDGNQFDSLTLSLNLVNLKRAGLLEDELDANLMKNWGVKVFSLSDYTFNVSESDDEAKKGSQVSSGAGADADETASMMQMPDQVVYICNKNHIIPDGLLELFTYISRDLHTEKPTLSSKLKGLVSLRDSITAKYKGKLDYLSNVVDCNLEHKELAKIYKDGQLAIYNLMLKELKSYEKQMLSDYRHELITMRDIYKKESTESVFKKLILNHFKFSPDSTDLSYAESFTIWLIWILKVVNYADYEPKKEDDKLAGFIPFWILPLFEQFKMIQFEADNEVDETDEEIENLKLMYEKLKPFTVGLHGEHWDFKSFRAVFEMFQQFSYEKGSKREKILVSPIILDDDATHEE